MNIAPNTDLKQLIVQLTDSEWTGMQVFGGSVLTELQVYAENFFVNKMNDFKQQQRFEISNLLAQASVEKLAEVVAVLTPTPPPEPEPEPPPVVEEPVVVEPVVDPPQPEEPVDGNI